MGKTVAVRVEMIEGVGNTSGGLGVAVIVTVSVSVDKGWGVKVGVDEGLRVKVGVKLG